MAMAFGLRLSLIAFSVIAFDGLLRGGTFEDTVRLALIVGAVFWGLGLLMGEVARRVVEENVEAELSKAQTNPASEAASTRNK